VSGAGGTLPVIERHARLRDEALVRDKSYQQTPIGQQVKRWLEAKRWEGSPGTTLDSYETLGAALAREFDYMGGLQDFPMSADGVGLLRHFLERGWGDRAAETRRQRQSALSSFFQWAVEEGLIEQNLVRRIRRPGKGARRRQAHALARMVHLMLAQDTVRDRCAIQLLIRGGLRKDELRRLQIRDVRLETMIVRVQGKGGKVRELPLEPLPSLHRDLRFHIQTDERQPTEYLLYPKDDRLRPMDRSSVHRWFKRCLARAGMDDFPMHEIRHTAGDAFFRATGDIVVTSLFLGHESVATTERYLHPTSDDLIRGLQAAEAAWREAVNEASEELSRS